jgi:NAD(P)-dependent dehydrogenase (short-subunit alcohol dehydrogenase family)
MRGRRLAAAHGPLRPVVLVTGTSSGIGRATAEELARRGHTVFASGRRLADVPATPDGAAGRIEPVELDVRSDEDTERVVGEVLERAGRLDVVVNNAGIGIAGAVEETSADEVREQLETNVLGVWRLCRAAPPVMRAAGGGLIVNLSSLSGLVATPYQGAYSASKFAVEGLSESLRLEVAPFGIQVVLVEPGFVATGMTAGTPRAAASLPAYTGALERALAAAVRGERAGVPAAAVAATIARVVTTRRPRLRWTVGRPAERAGAQLKRGLPWPAMERIVARTFRL